MEEEREEEYDDKIVLFSNACTEILFFSELCFAHKVYSSLQIYMIIYLKRRTTLEYKKYSMI